MPPAFLWDAQVDQRPPPPGTAEGGCQAAQVWGREASTLESNCPDTPEPHPTGASWEVLIFPEGEE